MWMKWEVASAKRTMMLAALLCASLITLGADPRQGNVPPQPFFADTIFGNVSLQGYPAPKDTELVACIDDCTDVFESSPVLLSHDGSFNNLKVDPEDQTLVGHRIAFYLVNDFGRIQARETVRFEGGPEIHSVRLTFSEAMPVPTPIPTLTPTAALPATGDPVVIVIPKMVLVAGAIAVVGGLFLVYVTRHRAF